jgi:hypothetical protein
MKKIQILLAVLFISFNCQANGLFKNTFFRSAVTCKSANADELIEYSFEIINSINKTQSFSLSIQSPRNLACKNVLLDSLIEVGPNQVYKGKLSVSVSNRIPIGGRESSFVVVSNKQNKQIEKLEFISVRYKPHPFLLVTDEIIENVKAKAKNIEWAKQNLEGLIEFADSYKVPERKIVLKARNTREWKSMAYNTSDGEKAFKVLLAYKLTGNKIYLNKIVRFITEACDKEKGYLSVGAATTGVQVHEGNFFMYLAAACDLIYEDAIFSKSDRKNIEATFRYYLEQNKEHMNAVGIMNHQASANAGAIFVALFLQDMAEIDHLTYADGGMEDQIAKGTMADGWWFEGTVNYCYLVTYKYATVAQAYENYGWNLYDKRFPVRYKSKDFDNAKDGYTGMKFDIWGPTGKNTRGLEDMFSAFVPMMDENAYVVSSNDSDTTAPHRFYELAYRHFRKDELAWVLNHSKRDSWEALVYGVKDVPEIEDPRSQSAYVSNVGLTALRSQKEGETAENQIQAYTKFGTHGGWHGHFDRASLIALDRNGHKYFGTEMVWYGYGHAGYKESVQTSASHNMVIVDELQQEAVPSEQLLFYAGKKMQVNVLETKARWRKIPTFNRELFPPWNDKQYDPEFKAVQQKRLTIVTDDYVVVADYMNALQKHTYDCLLHPIGLKATKGLKKKGALLDSLSSKFDSPYKYFKNAQWFKMNKGSELHFEEGDASLDVHTIWPKKAAVIVSDYPNGGKPRGIRNNPDRKTYGIRLKSKEAFFLNVLEPYKGKSVIKKIESKTENELVVYLVDGRKQKITITNLQQDNTEVQIEEYMDGKFINSEKTTKN